MRNFIPGQIQNLLTDVFKAAGSPTDIAGYVSASLVDASLKGVDSHGVKRVSLYVEQIGRGWIKPDARPVIEKETATTATVQGNHGFGIHALGFAGDVAIQKARTHQVAAVGLVGTTHTGRLGQFVELATEQGVLMNIYGGGAGHRGGGQVAPHGGSKRIVSTNPYAIGMPGGQFGTVVVDIATSVTAEGNLQAYRSRGEPLPPGWIIDNAGRPSTNVEDFYNGGALLPAGRHKGYALALAAEWFCGSLLGVPHELNWFIQAVDISAFRALDEFTTASESFLERLKAVPPALGFDEVLFPGELESRAARHRAIEGIPIPDEIWSAMADTARKVGVDPDSYVNID